MSPSPTSLYTLSLHDALPILLDGELHAGGDRLAYQMAVGADARRSEGERLALGRIGYELRERGDARSEEHTSELQSLRHLVCRLLLEKKKKNVMSGE